MDDVLEDVEDVEEEDELLEEVDELLDEVDELLEDAAPDELDRDELVVVVPEDLEEPVALCSPVEPEFDETAVLVPPGEPPEMTVPPPLPPCDPGEPEQAASEAKSSVDAAPNGKLSRFMLSSTVECRNCASTWRRPTPRRRSRLVTGIDWLLGRIGRTLGYKWLSKGARSRLAPTRASVSHEGLSGIRRPAASLESSASLDAPWG